MLCVGAAKAGTTWLYNHLAGHPDCHLRSIKELHYFDAVENNGYGHQLRVQQAAAEKLSRRMVKSGATDRLAEKLRDVLDWIRILKQRRDDRAAYLAYLAEGRGTRRLVADITPAYALLPEARLRDMACMAGDVRFVYLLRDPVSRLWSQVRMMAERAAKAADAVPDAAFALMERVLRGEDAGGALSRGDYVGAITRLRAAVAPQRLMLLTQDDMLTAPGLARLCAFLGIGVRAADFGHRVHEGAALAMTADHRARAQVLLMPQYEFVARQFPALPEAWRRNMGEGLL
nr:sulfotransferase [Fertoeibacter niger]